MPYRQCRTKGTLIIADEDAYDYAKAELDNLTEKDKRDFVDWFYSVDWIHVKESELNVE